MVSVKKCLAPGATSQVPGFVAGTRHPELLITNLQLKLEAWLIYEIPVTKFHYSKVYIDSLILTRTIFIFQHNT
jgi:hypothetical protein